MEAERYLRDVFRLRVLAFSSLAEARALAPVAADHPGARYHAHLAEFLVGFEVPQFSTLAERILFIALARKLDGLGELEEGMLARIDDRFRKASPPTR